jgi:2-dehydropantoate 2-reductase
MAHEVLIQGIGGIGGVIAGKLVQAGRNPVLVTGNPAIRDAIRERGLEVITPEERFTVRTQAYASLDEVPAPEGGFPAAWLLMKATGVVEAARRTLPLLSKDGYLVTFQNGIVEDAVAEAVGAERVISGIVGWGGTLHAPGKAERTGPGKIHVGELDGRISDRLRGLADALRPASEVEITTNVRGALWAKLAINCTITTLGALTGQTLGEMLRERPNRDAFLGLYREVIDTANALGVTLEPIAADPLLLYLPRRAGWFLRWRKDLVTRILGRKYRLLRSSSLQSLERGRKTEIDFLNGYVVAQAARVGVGVPLNTCVVRLIHEIEEGKRPLQASNLKELLAADRA